MALLTRVSAKKSSFVVNFHNKLTINQSPIKNLKFIFRDLCFLGKCNDINSGTTHAYTRNLTSKVSSDSNKETRLKDDFYMQPNTFENVKGTNINDAHDNDNAQASVGIFDKYLWDRRRESKRTIIMQVQSPDSYKDLYSYCSEFGPIKTMHHYVVAKNTHFFLVEFGNADSHKAAIAAATHINNQDVIPTHSHMLWFRNSPRRHKKVLEHIPPMSIATGDKPSDERIVQEFSSTNSMSKQIELLHSMWKLDDISTRLRFLTALQLENSLVSLFSDILVLPFGSSVNSFGKRGCDLDLFMSLDGEKKEKIFSRLVFQTKSSLPDERAQIRKSMEIISNIMQAFLPGIRNIRKILHARVPIIKYDHTLTGLECDLSMSNMSAVHMSELLYIFGECDDRVKPLVFSIRHWAAAVGLTNSNPGSWITNFSLTLLIIYFLQQKKILPSINTLKKLARPSDIRITESCIDCTFLRDPRLLPNSSSPSKETLEVLLFNFYNFYANFDFATKGICLRDAKSLYKPDSSPLFISNPLEKGLNVSKNVSSPEVMRFINSVRNAAMLMEEGLSTHTVGLLDIFAEKQPQKKQFILGRGNSNKKVRIAELFRTESPDKLDNEILRPDSKKERARRR